jgi:hypothetical protein
MVSLTRRTAGCGPACPVVWEGRTGNRLPYPDQYVHARQRQQDAGATCFWLLLPWLVMAGTKGTRADLPTELAERLTEALQRERVVPRFVDSYVVEHGRYGLQVDAALYRDLLGLLNREALLAVSARALELAGQDRQIFASSKPLSFPRKDAAAFRRKYLAALTRHHKWTAGDALDFQKDFRVYEEVIARSASGRRRKPFEAANHPFVDRCAFLLDSSFLELARLAASRALTELEDLAAQVVAALPGGTNHSRGRGNAPRK